VETQHHLSSRFIVSIAAAEAREAAGDLEGAQRLLSSTRARAAQVGYAAWVLEADLGLARIVADERQAAARLAALAREADTRGMGLVAAQARALLREPLPAR
jgi:hypothetical protein